MKDSPSSLILDKCVYESLVPSEYVSLDSIIYEIKQKEGKIRNTSIRDKENKLRNMTPAWMIRQLWKYPDQGITQMRTYVHPTFKEEIDEQLINKINDLPEKEALWYLQKVKTPQWIEATGKREMDIRVIITTLDTEESFDTMALIDTGCMTSAISKQFVEENKINTTKLPRAITAVNADGTPNQGGPITDMVILKMRIHDHEETFELAVVNIGKKDVFLGHDWIEFHNPEVDWIEQKIKFSRCPGECYEESWVNEPEDEIETYGLDEDKILAIEIN